MRKPCVLKKIQPDKKITKKVLAKPEYIMYNTKGNST